ncbi:hypothetical protein ACO29I_03705 [Eggerthellaceae bacterium DNF00809]
METIQFKDEDLKKAILFKMKEEHLIDQVAKDITEDGITLEDVPDYINVHEQEQEKPCKADVFTSALDAAEKQAALENTHRPPHTPPTQER